MDLEKLKSIDDASDRELLLIILSTQLQIARRLEFIEARVSNYEPQGVERLAEDITNKLQSFLLHLDHAITKNNT